MRLDFKNFYAWPLSTRCLLMGLACVILFYFAYDWDIKEIESRLLNHQNKETELKQQLAIIVNKEVSIANQLTQYATLSALLTEWQKKVISYEELPELLNTILKIGASNHIYFTQFTPAKEKSENRYIQVPIKMTAVGHYHQLADFISQIVNLPWLVVIDEFTLTRETRNDVIGAKLAAIAQAQNLLTGEINFIIYRLAKPGEIMDEASSKEGAASIPSANAQAKGNSR